MDDTTKIAKSPWVRGRVYLTLQRWTFGFDPVTKLLEGT